MYPPDQGGLTVKYPLTPGGPTSRREGIDINESKKTDLDSRRNGKI